MTSRRQFLKSAALLPVLPTLLTPLVKSLPPGQDVIPQLTVSRIDHSFPIDGPCTESVWFSNPKIWKDV